jgi:PAS domain S-box-containing protein
VAFEAAFEHSYNAMVITDADFDGGPFIQRCNPAFCAMTGYTEKELIGQSPRILQGPDTDRQLIDQLKRTIRAGEFFEGSTVNYRKDGGSYLVEWNISPVRDADGVIVAYISIQQDITVRISAEREAEEARVAESEALLRAAGDSLLDPQVLLEAARDSSGQIVDFLYRDVNRATCDYLGLSRVELIGRGVVETMPGIRDTLLISYIQCLDTGEPLILSDFSYDNEILADSRRYDLRATRTTPTSIALTWRDVTDRFQSVQRLAASERSYRLLAENATDVIVHVRDGTVVWVSPSVSGLLGAPDSYWVGRPIREVIPPEDAPAFARRMATLASGETVSDRIRVVSMDGVTHWISLRAQPFYDDAGHVDGFLASLRAIDDEVAAQQELARYKQLIETSSVGTALSNLDGSMAVVNQAMCDLAGFDMDTALHMSWTQVIPEPHLHALLGAIDDLLAGRIDSYRGEHVFIHADGHPRWIDMSLTVMRKPDGQPEYVIFQSVNITAEIEAREQLESARGLLAASADSMLDPQVLMEAVRDPAGQVLDFRYISANQATLSYLRVTEQEFIGRSALDTLPNLEESGLLGRYAQCLADGEPVVLNDFSYFNHIIDDDRRYDIRATRAGPDLLTLSWTDVTERFHTAKRIASSERAYRLLAENSSDMVTHVRDGRFAWTSPSVADVVGGSPEYWVGRQVREIIPPEDAAAFAARLATLTAGGTIQQRIRVVAVDGVTHWADLHARPLYDDDGHQDGFTDALRLVDDEVAAQQDAEQSRRQQARADALYRQSVDSAAVGTCLINPEGGFVDVNQAVCEFFGYDAETLKSKTWQELTAEAYMQADLEHVADVLAGRIESYRMTKQYIHADGHPIWGDLSVGCIRDSDGHVEVFISQINDITAQVQAREQLEEARREQQRDDARYRNSIDNASVGMCMVTPEGRLQNVNRAMCQLFGYEAEAMNGTHWQDFTAPEFLDAELNSVNGIREGRIDSYRMVKHYRHADGHLVWGDLSVSGVRDENGKLEHMVALITDVTARFEADELNRVLAQQLQQQTDRMKSELDSAAAYMASLMPSGLQGPVTASSRYLPSRELGGDCLDYYWIDDDHLLIKLIDVSGHGLEPALLAVSVHNLMRSGSLARETLLSPEAVLTELNRLFVMEQQSDHYFTMWYGIYEKSTRTLRYASAGAPPALAFNAATGTAIASTALSTPASPVGVFEDTEFTSRTYHVPPGCQILIYSDGASEITLADGQQLTGAAFEDLTNRVAASPDWSLDDLIDELRALTPTEVFEDDFSLIQLTFD